MKRYLYAVLMLFASGHLLGQVVINSLEVNSPDCNGICNGSILNIVGAGTSGPWEYSSDGGASYSASSYNPFNFTGLCVGSYIIRVRDEFQPLDFADTIVTITEPSILNPFAGIDITVCEGDAVTLNGSANGGTPSYTYQWDNGVTDAVAFLANVSTNYTLTATDGNGCSATDVVLVTVIAAPIADAGLDHAVCENNGNVNLSGSVTNATGGAWTTSGTGTFTPNSSTLNPVYIPSANDISSGWVTLTLTTTGNGGCSAAIDNSDVTINPLPFVIISSITDVTCFGDCNGTASIIEPEGVGPFSYSWTSGGSSIDETGLCPGTYSIAVTDGNSCTATDVVTITEPPLLEIADSSSNVVCHSDCDGSATATPSGGTGSYNYSWSNGSTGQTANGLCPGVYDCIISDGNGCQDSITQVITEPALIEFTTAVQNISCYGAADGSIIFTASGGTGSLEYSADEGSTWQTSNIFTGVPFGGLWGIIVRDDLLCQTSSSVNITEPSDIIFSVASTNPTACNVADGSFTISELMQDSSYNIFYTDQNGMQSQTGGTANIDGEVTVSGFSSDEISDITVELNTCSAFMDTLIYLTAPTFGFAMNTASALVTNASCTNTDGSITGIAVSGGSGTYTYNYTGGTSNLDLLNAQPGSYVLTITDTDGCVIESTPFTINSTISTITLSSATTSASCNGNCDGGISTVASGGDGVYTYTCSNGMVGDSLINVCAGIHTIWVIDGLGCQGIDTVTVLEPAVISNTISSVAPACGSNDGSAEVTSTSGGVSPYTYQWSNGSVAALADSLLAGVYAVTVTDDALCTTIEIVNITSSTSPSITSTFMSPTCSGGNNGSIDLTISGGTAPFSFDWSTGENTEDISNLAAGIYDVAIMDSSGCGIVQTFALTDAMAIDLSAVAITDASCGSADGIITVTASGGAGGYNYLWSIGGTGATEVGLAPGTYTLSVSDANGCLAMANYAVSNASGPVIIVDQVIQPTCQGGSGEILVSVSGGAGSNSYLWSNGATSEDLFNAPVGSYELIVTDANGCQGVEYAELLGVNLNAAEICMVTVDTTTGSNIVVWTKEYNLGISEYQIYKETSSLNVFQLLGAVPFDSLTQFIDTAANSSIHSYRYKLRTLDSCSNASEFLAYHKTIHLVSNIGLNNVINLLWDDYIGFSYSTFYINRYHPSTGWEVIDSVAANVHSYTDNTYPSLAGLEYGIEVVPISPCSAEKAQDHNSTRSNRASIVAPNGGPTVINENPVIDFTLFPNPTDGKFTLSFSGDFSEVNVKVFDVQGKVLTSFYVGNASGAKEFDISNYEKGMYLIQVSSENEIRTVRLIKQ